MKTFWLNSRACVLLACCIINSLSWAQNATPEAPPRGFDLETLKEQVGDNVIFTDNNIVAGAKNVFHLRPGRYRIAMTRLNMDFVIFNMSNSASISVQNNHEYFSFEIKKKGNYKIELIKPHLLADNTWIGSLFSVYDPNWQLEVKDLRLKAAYDEKILLNNELEGKIAVFFWHFTYPKNSHFNVDKLNYLADTFKENDNVLFFFACPHSKKWAKEFVNSTGLKFIPIHSLPRVIFQYKNTLTAPSYFIFADGKVVYWHLSDHVNIDKLLAQKIRAILP